MESPEIRPCTCGIGGYYVVYDWAANERKRPMWHRLTMEHAIALRDADKIVDIPHANTGC